MKSEKFSSSKKREMYEDYIKKENLSFWLIDKIMEFNKEIGHSLQLYYYNYQNSKE